MDAKLVFDTEISNLFKIYNINENDIFKSGTFYDLNDSNIIGISRKTSFVGDEDDSFTTFKCIFKYPNESNVYITYWLSVISDGKTCNVQNIHLMVDENKRNIDIIESNNVKINTSIIQPLEFYKCFLMKDLWYEYINEKETFCSDIPHR